MKKVLVDSNILIDHMRGLESARSFFESAESKFELYLSVVSIVEVYSGKDTKEPMRLRELENLLSNFEISLITPGIAKQAGFFRRDYQKPFADMLIAATAVEYDFILATRNIQDFSVVPKLKLFKPYAQ